MTTRRLAAAKASLPGLALLGCLAAGATPALAMPGAVDCVVEPAQKVKIGSATLGVLKEVGFNRGDEVMAGQVVARLESSLEEATLALVRAQAGSTAAIDAQRARVQLYKRRMDRQHQLSQGISTQEKIDQVEADHEIGQRDLQAEILKHDIAAIEVKRAQAQLDMRVIRSPISGLVTEKLMAVGEFVRQDSAVYTLVQLDPLYVEAYVSVKNWPDLHLGSTGIVELEKPIGGKYDAKVTVVDHVFDAASGTFGVRLELPNPGNDLPAGQRCKVTFRPASAKPMAEAQ